jgi:hypothetical protein
MSQRVLLHADPISPVRGQDGANYDVKQFI